MGSPYKADRSLSTTQIEQFSPQNTADNSKYKMDTSSKDLLLDAIDDLVEEEYRRFKWKLDHVRLKEGYRNIPKSYLENAKQTEVVDKMIDFYGDDYAMEVAAETLGRINRNDLVEKLKGVVQQFNETASLKPQTLSADTPETRSRLPVALQRLKNTHKSFLIRKFECVSECIAKPGEQPLLNEVFTSLHITEGECGELNYNHEVRQIESKKARSQALPITCSDIFIPSERSPKRIRTVLTKGIAGIGKTFSVQKFILDWAAGDDNCAFDFIYIFPFRELNLIKEEISLVELVQLFYPHMKDCEDVSSLDSTKVLYIFDGLDESRLHLDFTNCGKLCDVKKSTVLDVLLINLIKGDLLPSASLWITSRPAAASHIPYQYISRLTEIQGFEDQQKEEYFRKKFKDQTLAEKILLHVRMLRSVHVMCYVPAFCWIIATVLGHTLGENGNENIPRTLTEVYTHFLLVLLALQNQKHENIKLLKENQEDILNLGKLAFLNLERNNLIFYEDDLRECGIDIRQSSVYSGVCREIFKENSTIFKETVYSFIHLTVQEYFAALYVFASFQIKNHNPLKQTVIEKFRGIFRTRLCDVYNIALNKATKSRNGHLDLFLRFLLGLGMKTNQELLKGLLLKTQDKSKDIQKITKDIKQMIRKNTSPEGSINLFHCLNELNDNSLVKNIEVSLTSGNLLQQNLSPSDYSALAYVLQMSEDELDALDLSSHSLRDEGLLRLMPAARLYKRLMLRKCDLTGDCCEDLASALCANHSTLRELQLEGNNLGDSGVKLLSAALKDPNCKLEKLGLFECDLTGVCCEDLASALRTNHSTLRELELGWNNLGSSGGKLLSAALKDPNCKLKKLGLRGCHLTGDCYEDLASALRTNQSTLRELKLGWNNLGDSGMKLLSAALKDPNCKLKKLELTRCRLTGDCCEDLASALRTNHSTLRELELGWNNLGLSGAKLLSAALNDPNCKLEKLGLLGCCLRGDSCEDLAFALRTN